MQIDKQERFKREFTALQANHKSDIHALAGDYNLSVKHLMKYAFSDEQSNDNLDMVSMHFAGYTAEFLHFMGNTLRDVIKQYYAGETKKAVIISAFTITALVAAMRACDMDEAKKYSNVELIRAIGAGFIEMIENDKELEQLLSTL